MSGPTCIQPDAFYDADALCETLGLRLSSIDKARLAGELRSTRRGGVPLFLGSWVTEWLLKDQPARPSRRKAVMA